MANIFDYLDWRGDLSFAVSPFNEVDNYIVCKIGSPDFSGIVPEDGTRIPLAEAVERYVAREGENVNLGLLSSDFVVPMVRRLPNTPRFAGLELSHFVNHLDAERQEQYSALTVWLPDGSRYVSFRGTDDTLVSWKENFLMGVENSVAAQEDAAAYLAEEARRAPGRLYVGGHSKGGNLSVYAAMHVPAQVQARLISVYNHDGPGFRVSVLEDPAYLAIRSRVVTICPQRSIVGQLLCQESNVTIVESSGFGPGAHDGFTWEVLGTQFVRCPEFSISSRAFRASLSSILETLNEQEKRDFIEELFGLLSATGAVTLSDLTEKRLRNIVELARGVRHSPAVTRFVGEVLEGLLREYVDSVKLPKLPKLRYHRKQRG